MLIVLTILAVVVFFPTLLRWTDDVVYYVQNNILVCPRCHSALKRVNVKCPGCNNVFANLYPTYRRPFYMKCFACGSRLATTRLFGRTNYESFCPNCMAPLGLNASEGKVVAFPIAGGAASGKTTFLMSSLGALTYDLPNARKWKASFPYKNDELLAKRLNKLFKNGELPNKTNERVPQAFCLDYKTGLLRENLHLCIYDPSGETFAQDYEYLEKQGYYDFMSGLIFIVDPFSFPKLRDKYKKALEKDGENLEFSEVDPTLCLERLLHRLDEYGKAKKVGENAASNDAVYQDLSLKPLKELPCAIVITKLDAFDLDKYIGDEGVRKFREKNPQYDEDEATDILCRYWLKRWGGHNILGNLDSIFGQTRCFAVSSLGEKDPYSGYATGFKPRHMDAPFKWLLKTAGTRGMNKWGVLLFLFGVVLAVSAIGAGTYKLAKAERAAKIESEPSPTTAAPSPAAASPAQDDSVAQEQFRYLCYEAYDKSAESLRFDRDAVLSSIDSAESSSGISARELDALKSAPTLELVVKIRNGGGNIDSARSQVRRVEEAAQSALFNYFADDSIDDEAARNQRDAVRDVAFKKYERCAEKVSFDKSFVIQRVQYAALAAKLNDEALNVVGARTTPEFLSYWHKFDEA
ncbi:MAG: hypothetical protein J6X44_04495, partial [Thermoguttaceae bacterium]|nr:hypothetical protein [Thermoguttaceae bacterium]